MTKHRILIHLTQISFFAIFIYCSAYSFYFWEWKSILVAVLSFALSFFFYKLNAQYASVYAKEMLSLIHNDFYSKSNRRLKRKMIRSMRKSKK